MDFATRLNIPNTLPSTAQNREDWRIKFKQFLLDSMGIAHTEDTKVGDAFVRGVSGGERKRVSIIETLCTRGSVMAWDNSVSRSRRYSQVGSNNNFRPEDWMLPQP
jgi:ABC-type multidrug transport system ATPase subunit